MSEGKGGVGAAVNLSSGQHPVSWGPTLGILSPGFLAHCLTLMVIAGLLPRYHHHHHPQPHHHHYPTPLCLSPSCSQDCRPQEQRGTARWTWAYPTCVTVVCSLSLPLFGVLELLLDFCVLMIVFFSIAATRLFFLGASVVARLLCPYDFLLLDGRYTESSACERKVAAFSSSSLLRPCNKDAGSASGVKDVAAHHTSPRHDSLQPRPLRFLHVGVPFCSLPTPSFQGWIWVRILSSYLSTSPPKA